MGKKIGIGIIGCGMISASHVRGYLDLPERAQILAVCDTIEENVKNRAAGIISECKRRAQQVAEEIKKAESAEEKEKLTAKQALLLEYSKSEIKMFSDYNEMLKLPDIDAVSVCTPPFVHAPATIAAARAGKHVYCEKPMSRTATEAKMMCEECNKAGVKLGYQSGGTRLGAINYAIRDYIASGKLGDVYYGRQTSFRVRGRPGLDMPNFSKWFLDSTKGGGGSLYDIGVYQIDKVLYLLGDPQPATISGIAYRGAAPEYTGDGVYDVDEHVSVFVRFSNGMSFTFEDGWVTNMSDLQEGIFIFGSKGAFRNNTLTVEEGKWDKDDKGRPRRYQAKLVEKELAVPDIPNPGKIGDFLNACSSDRKPICAGEDGMKIMEIMSGALLSAKLGREITVPELYAIEAMRSEPTPGWPIL
ncbi:MAG: Gfo/Idh/MocA family protein [Candidatus Poribacteria bacterium]